MDPTQIGAGTGAGAIVGVIGMKLIDKIFSKNGNSGVTEEKVELIVVEKLDSKMEGLYHEIRDGFDRVNRRIDKLK